MLRTALARVNRYVGLDPAHVLSVVVFTVLTLAVMAVVAVTVGFPEEEWLAHAMVLSLMLGITVVIRVVGGGARRLRG